MKLGRLLGSCQRSEIQTERNQVDSVRAVGLESLCIETGAPELQEEGWKWELELLLQQK